MRLDNLEINIDDNGIANLIINSKNTLINKQFIENLKEAIDCIINNKNIVGVIISSKSYNYNYDIDFLFSLNTSALIFENITKLSSALRKLENIGKPIVSIISGSVELGGLEIILHSHYKIANIDSNTKFIFKNLKYSLSPAIGASQRLPRQIGIENSLRLFLSNKIINAKQALKLKIVNEIAKKDALMNKAKEYILKNSISYQPWDDKKYITKQPNPFSQENLGYFISKIAMLHAKNSDHYPSVKILISAIFEGLNTNMHSGLKIEARHFTWLLQNTETKSMLTTLILNKPQKELDNAEITIFKKSFVENYAAEGVRLLINGASAAMIENAGKRLGFELGPLATADILEIQCIIAQLDSTDASIAALIRSMQKINRNGLSNKKGFYDYKERGIKNIWNGLTDIVPPAKIQPAIKEIENRLLYSTINNIFYNYIKYSEFKSYEMYDYMAINNIGFPEWTGGPFRWVKQNGVESFIKNNHEYAKTLGSRFVINNKIINVIKNL